MIAANIQLVASAKLQLDLDLADKSLTKVAWGTQSDWQADAEQIEAAKQLSLVEMHVAH